MADSHVHYGMDAVLAVPELLEAIFCHVDMKTLLLSIPRVNMKWNSIVSTSPAVQQALFFRPISSNRDECGKDGPEPILNPLLIEKFGSCFFDFGPTYGFVRRAGSFLTLPWTANHHQTIHINEAPYRTPSCKVAEPSNADALDLDILETFRANDDRRRFTHRGASWRKMLVSQPPPPGMGFLWWETESSFSGPQTVSTQLVPARTTDGLRMGELFDFVQYHAGHHKNHSLWYRVTWGRPQQPFVSWMCEYYCEKLFEKTNVVVECLHKEDELKWNHPREPADVDVFDFTFRCDEYSHAKVEPQTYTAYEPGMLGMDFNAIVWSSCWGEDPPLPEYLNLWGYPAYS